MKTVLLIAGHKNITTLTSEGLRTWRSATALRKSTGAAGEREWVWDKLIPLLRDKLIAAGVQVFITDAIYHPDVYSRDYDLCLALHFDGGGTDSRCIIGKPNPNQTPPYIFPEASAKADEFIAHWLATYPAITGIASHQDRISEGMTDYYAWDYVKEGTPAVLIEHGNHTCPADYDTLFSRVETVAEADVEAVKRFFHLNQPETPPTPPTPTYDGNPELVKLQGAVQQVLDEVSNVKRRLEEQQKSLDILNGDRDILETMQATQNSIQTAIELNKASVTSLEKQGRENHRELGDKLADLDNRVKNLEAPEPKPKGEGIEFKTIIKLGGLFIGKLERR